MKEEEGMVHIIEPESIAVIGASDDPGKWGGKITANLKKGYNGKIFPVNPNKDEILGLKCYPSVLEIPSEYNVKTAIITVPAKVILQTVEECGEYGIKGLIIITAGFAETGTKEGIKLQKKLDEIVQKYGMRYLGPNCLGIIVPRIGMNASNAGSGEKIKPGKVAFILQSGTVALDVASKARKMRMGVRAIISVGNGANIGVEDWVEYFINDPGTNLIAIYSEGIKDGKRLMELAQNTEKHVIMLKVGRTETGAKAANSHTASMAGSDDVYTVAFKQAGIIRVANITELLHSALAFSSQPVPESSGVGIVSNGGGPLIMVADAIERNGIKIREFETTTLEKIRELLPAHVTAKNPLDMGGITTKETFRDIVGAVIEGSDSAIVTYVQEPENPEILLDVYKNPLKPIMVCWVGNGGGDARKELEESGVSVFDDPAIAAETMAHMLKRGEYLKKAKLKDREVASVEKSAIRPVNVWGVIEKYGIPTLPSELVAKVEYVASVASEIGFPVVMKIESPEDISHKSDVGGVVLNIASNEEAEKAFVSMMDSVKSKRPNARIEGVSIHKMAEEGKEFIVGAKRDPSFGPVIIFGSGGTDTELIKDLSMRISPVDMEMAKEMVMETKLAPYFSDKGYRGKRLDIEVAIDAIVAMSKIMMKYKTIKDIEINPLIVYEDGAVAVDARMFVS